MFNASEFKVSENKEIEILPKDKKILFKKLIKFYLI